MSTAAITPGQSVRVVQTGANGRVALIGHVIGVAPIAPENLGTNGEPTITALILNPSPANISQLGRIDWHQALDRLAGLRHVSHPDVVAGRVSVCYVDTVDNPGSTVTLPALNLDDLSSPPAEVQGTQLGNEASLYESNGLHIVDIEGEFVTRYDDDEDFPDGRFRTLAEAKAFVDAKNAGVGIHMGPLTPTVQHTQAESFRKAAEAVPGAGPANDALGPYTPEEVYHNEKNGYTVETCSNGSFLVADAEGDTVCHTDSQDVMSFPTKQSAIDYVDSIEKPEYPKEVDGKTIVTSSGKTQEELDADHAQQAVDQEKAQEVETASAEGATTQQ